jgi:hypothetical protein
LCPNPPHTCCRYPPFPQPPAAPHRWHTLSV